MKHTIFPELSSLVPVTKRVEISSSSLGKTGYKSVPDGFDRVTTEVVVDTEQLHYMAVKAARSARGKCVDGPITVRVLRRVKV